jgi:hypothetical protein
MDPRTTTTALMLMRRLRRFLRDTNACTLANLSRAARSHPECDTEADMGVQHSDLVMCRVIVLIECMLPSPKMVVAIEYRKRQK